MREIVIIRVYFTPPPFFLYVFPRHLRPFWGATKITVQAGMVHSVSGCTRGVQIKLEIP